MTHPTIRPGHDSDADAVIALIGACWSQYPGVLMDVDGEVPELRALASYYAGKGGAFWVAEADDAIIGMIATRPLDAAAWETATRETGAWETGAWEIGAWEICRVYVLPTHHGGGLGHRLLDTAEAHAIAAGAQRLVLWSDTRFDRAHRFYEKRSYVRSGPIRVLDDISHSLEFAYAKPVNGVEALDAAGAASAIPRLSTILQACVAEGASVSFLPPLPRVTARAFWQQEAKQMAAGNRVLLAGWVDGVLSGTVGLAFPTAQNQPHRAGAEMLLVHPDTRRRGLGRTLMQRLEQQAAQAGRTLLVLETRAGDAAECLYRAMGWTEAGCIPGFALAADGTPTDTLLFWKRLG